MDLCHTSIHTVFVFVFVTHFITQSTLSQIHKHIHRRGLCVCWWTFVIHNLIVTVFLYCQHCHTQIQTVLSIILSHRKNTNKGAGLSVCLLIEQTSKHRCTSELCDELHSFRIYQNNWNVELFLSSMLTADLTYNKWWQYSHGQWAEIINIPKYASFKNVQDQRNFRWIEIFWSKTNLLIESGIGCAHALLYLLHMNFTDTENVKQMLNLTFQTIITNYYYCTVHVPLKTTALRDLTREGCIFSPLCTVFNATRVTAPLCEQ